MPADDVRFSVPSSEISSIKTLAHTDLKDLEAIERVLSVQAATLDADALSKSVAVQSGVDVGSVQAVLSVLRRWAYIQRKVDLTAESFLDAMKSSVLDNPAGWSPEDSTALREREQVLAKMLSPVGTLGLIAKATDLMVEQQALFCRARIITDARPIFDEKADQLQGFLTLHCLALTYHEGPDTRHIHIVLDGKDIRKLRDQLDRAEKKEVLMAKRLSEAGLAVVETEASANA